MYVNLNTFCEIQYKVVTTEEAYGTESIKWRTKARVWAELQDVLPSRAENVTNNIDIALNRTRVRMRYRNDIDSAMRFKARGYTYQFVAGPAMIGRNEYMEFVAERYSS